MIAHYLPLSFNAGPPEEVRDEIEANRPARASLEMPHEVAGVRQGPELLIR